MKNVDTSKNKTDFDMLFNIFSRRGLWFSADANEDNFIYLAYENIKFQFNDDGELINIITAENPSGTCDYWKNGKYGFDELEAFHLADYLFNKVFIEE